VLFVYNNTTIAITIQENGATPSPREEGLLRTRRMKKMMSPSSREGVERERERSPPTKVERLYLIGNIVLSQLIGSRQSPPQESPIMLIHCIKLVILVVAT